MSSPESFTMPKVNQGDIVLFSTDFHSFSNPVVAFVTQVGDSTISCSVVTPAGLLWKTSVRHREDPALRGDHGWDDLGVWDFSEVTKAIYAAERNAKSPKASSASSMSKNIADLGKDGK